MVLVPVLSLDPVGIVEDFFFIGVLSEEPALPFEVDELLLEARRLVPEAFVPPKPFLFKLKGLNLPFYNNYDSITFLTLNFLLDSASSV